MASKEIPGLYHTENIPLEDKIIYQKWEIKKIGFYWLIAELDPKRKLAFGYANLNNDQMAEWGYISIEELLENGVTKVENWKPIKFKEIMEILSNQKQNE
ncbi:MAG: DUF2958 domain-containing protein [Candidatus Thorarchaeota archaeon]